MPALNLGIRTVSGLARPVLRQSVSVKLRGGGCVDAVLRLNESGQ